MAHDFRPDLDQFPGTNLYGGICSLTRKVQAFSVGNGSAKRDASSLRYGPKISFSLVRYCLGVTQKVIA